MRSTTSVVGTNRTSRAGLAMSAHAGRPEVTGSGQTDAIDPHRKWIVEAECTGDGMRTFGVIDQLLALELPHF
jgi:hypothetical protein